MEVRQLDYLLAVVDNGGFTRGAAAVHVSQPTLSHGIRALESELGIMLFDRLGRSVQLTAAGEAVVEAARRVLRDMADLTAIAASAAGMQHGRLDLASLPTLAVDPLANIIGRFRTEHPGVTVRVHEAEDVSAIEHQVSSGRAELGLTDVTTGGGSLVRIDLFVQELYAVCPKGTRIDTEGLGASQLAGMPMIATPIGTSTRRLLDQALRRAGVEPNIVVEVSQREAILPLVLAGAGTSLLPASLAKHASDRGAVVCPMRPTLTRRIGLRRRRGLLSPAAQAMVTIALAVTADQ